MHKKNILIVGAGFSGAIVARQLAESGFTIQLIDKRSHIAGNAYDESDKNGILIHRYGPHIFHTNSKKIVDYLSQFTQWRDYEHRVLARVDGQLVPIPVNQTTINRLYNLDLDETGISQFLENVRVKKEKLLSSEDVVLNSVGHDLCNKLFRSYTKKQWGLDLSELSAGVAARIPTRTNNDDRYFTDTYQIMPKEGYTKLFNNILDHPNINLSLNCPYFEIPHKEEFQHIVYTGPIDEFFNYCYGHLPYRSLQFKHEHVKDCEQYQTVGTVNYPNEHNYTRITEFKHLTGQKHNGTSMVKEYPQAIGEPFYPIPREANQQLYIKYRDLAKQQSEKISFVGRLAEYKYYNMDQVIGAALSRADKIIKKLSPE